MEIKIYVVINRNSETGTYYIEVHVLNQIILHPGEWTSRFEALAVAKSFKLSKPRE